VAISQILKEEGFARLPRRADEERPHRPGPTAADVADVRQLDLGPRRFRTRFGGLFLFLPRWPHSARRCWAGQLPGARRSGGAWRSLNPEVVQSGRHSHVMSSVFDPGLALWRISISKRSLTEYSCRTRPDHTRS
jgi:hypothetical protein